MGTTQMKPPKMKPPEICKIIALWLWKSYCLGASCYPLLYFNQNRISNKTWTANFGHRPFLIAQIDQFQVTQHDRQTFISNWWSYLMIFIFAGLGTWQTALIYRAHENWIGPFSSVEHRWTSVPKVKVKIFLKIFILSCKFF